MDYEQKASGTWEKRKSHENMILCGPTAGEDHFQTPLKSQASKPQNDLEWYANP